MKVNVNKTLSLAKINQELNKRNTSKLFYKDPSFTTRFNGTVLQKDYLNSTLFHKHLSNKTTLINTNYKARKMIQYSSLPKQVILSPPQYINDNNKDILYSALEKDWKREILKYSKSSDSMKNLIKSQSNKSIKNQCKSNRESRNFFDKYDYHLKFIDSFDQKYKVKMVSLELPKISHQMMIDKQKVLKNVYLQRKLY